MKAIEIIGRLREKYSNKYTKTPNHNKDHYISWLQDEYAELVMKQANGVNTEQKALHIDSVMPRRLTAENGAKRLLIGEFHETIICHDEDGEPYEVKMPVEWDTIKQIYAKIVDHYGA